MTTHCFDGGIRFKKFPGPYHDIVWAQCIHCGLWVQEESIDFKVHTYCPSPFVGEYTPEEWAEIVLRHVDNDGWEIVSMSGSMPVFQITRLY